jgi:hypothetical protein
LPIKYGIYVSGTIVRGVTLYHIGYVEVGSILVLPSIIGVIGND